MASSETKTDFWGNKYTQYYDDNGNESGTSEIRKDFWGDTYRQYYDNSGNDTGTSKTEKNFWGDSYTQHYNSSGDKTGTSVKEKDFWGDTYTQHYNNSGDKTGTSQGKKDFWGNNYVETKYNNSSNPGYSSKYKAGCNCADCKAERRSKEYISTCNCVSCKGKRGGKEYRPTCNCDSCRSARGGSYYSKPSSGFCYITTACVESMNLSDNCYELQTLRNFRDNFILKKENGVKLIEEYYINAPRILKSINDQPNPSEIYRTIFFKIKEAVNLIDNHELDKAFDLYCEITIKLNKKYCEIKN